ncbi:MULTISPECIES: cytochrome c biogenesis protein CcsA [Saccharomonospora]|uniref:Heme exporter protein C n=2 Tax=Saccharomonospora TaxID=1851 RepID=I1D4G4_9PSEU|nr:MULTISPECIES: cytochrome c biogenesis protein CcsA [Saccharomonospora]EHY87458.1 ABC-type transport system involved in cytochrome c biogenesis, permease component [Saccharomonospora azurea NA-128]EIE99838.1 ABC-type transport system involved in cytochrome c biogenesis, permease component [Saccharomonospora glauca K62]
MLFGRRLSIATALVVAIGIAGAMLAPPDRLQGNLQRLMYVHVPAAWVAYLSFAVTAGAAAAWLWRRQPRYDRIAVASAEAGVFFTGLAIVLGSIWGKPTWGVWWTWDPRVVTTAVMFFVYLGYLALRRATLDPVARARRSAVFGVVAFVQVPIVHMSVVWWRTLHQPPTVLKPGDPSIDHTMLAALLVNVLAFTLLYLVMVRARVRLEALEEELEARQVAEGRELAGNAVLAPRLEKGS